MCPTHTHIMKEERLQSLPSQTKAGSFEPAVLLRLNLRVYSMPLEESQKSYPSKGRRKKKSPKSNGDYCNEVVEWSRGRGPASGNTARNATISNTFLRNRTATTNHIRLWHPVRDEEECACAHAKVSSRVMPAILTQEETRGSYCNY